MKNKARTQVQWNWIAVGLLFLVTAPSAWAVGTAAGTSITNQATVGYDVGGVAQTAVLSDDPTVGGFQATAFVVDRRVDLTVAEANGTYTDVSPGAAAQVVTFTVANTGNATLDFDLGSVVNLAAGVADPFGGTDSLDITVVDVYVDADGSGPTSSYDSSAHAYDAGDTATFIDDLPQDEMINVYVVVNIPITAVDGNIAGVTLTALAQNTDNSALVQTAGADTANVVDTVFADGAGDADAARDAQHADTDAFRVISAVLTVTKTSTVTADPVNGTTNPKAIPGATVRYTLVVSNAAGSADAQNVLITDQIPVNTNYLVGSHSTGTIAYSDDNGVSYTYTPAGAGEDGNVDYIRITLGADIAAGASATVTFDVVIE